MRHALYLPPFGPLARPQTLVELAVAAEERGWDGLFLWDHVLRPSDEPAEIADPWIALAAVAAATTTIRLGPMVTPVVRRRPQKLAREAITLDHLSDGRVILGLGLGVDRGGELTRFGEITDARDRGDILDEGAALLAALCTGEEVHHRGRWFTADGVSLQPPPVQRPRVPMWFAARGGAARPTRRAARYEGLFPIEIDLDGLARSVALVEEVRGGLDGFDVAVIADRGLDLAPYERLGATWAMWAFSPGDGPDDVLTLVDRGPEGPATGPQA